MRFNVSFKITFSNQSKSMSKKKLGFWTSSALVVGNMIGAGIFLLPASLASFGSISAIGWVISAIGACSLAFVFIEISKMLPGISGGPYTYTREGLGDFAGFLVAWGYWVSLWCTNAAIVVALVSYLGVFIPDLNSNFFLATGIALTIIWTMAWLNSRGIREAGIFQLITTILKITPLLAIALFGLFYVDPDNFFPINVSQESNFNAITATVTLTFFAFMGLECATIPSADIENPEKTIPRSTYFGLAITTAVYIICTVVLMGVIPANELQNSSAPFSDAARIMWGSWAQYLVAGGAVISTLGALNGWILIQGQIPAAIARDKLFPSIFGRKNKNGAPAFSIVFSTILISILMIMNYSKGMAGAFQFALLLASMTSLIAYLFTSASYLVIGFKKKNMNSRLVFKIMVAVVAFGFSLLAVAGSGLEIVYWGFIGLMLGVPFYVWILIHRARNE